MEQIKCPKCKKEIDALADICPYCSEMIFYDTIVSDEGIVQGDISKFDKIKKSKIYIVVSKIIKSISKTKLCKKIKKICKKIKKKNKAFLNKIKKSRIYPYITYQNVLCIITLISTIFMVFMGIKIAKYTDNSSTLSKVDSKTTYQQVETMQKREKIEPKKSLDLQRGLIIMVYEDQKYAGIDATITYEVIPSTNKIRQTIITFDYDKNDVKNMKKYLEVNYGYARRQEDGTLLYVDREFRYTFTNGMTHVKNSGIEGDERVEIIPLNQDK